jgi:hypothetical protein
MPIRLPRKWWEWVLVFSPSVAFFLYVAIDAASAPPTVEAILADSRTTRSEIGLCVLIVFWLVAGLHFTNPDPNRYVCIGCFLLILGVVAAVNIAVAYLCSVLFIR